ncbi:phage portal protein [Aneurinibacillus thermoaerophilus]|uniref:phage portal protein n=1 Tax=Aneurinibacillus thermoaerophilus TaxID=143495 RepID=UPI002E1B1ABB|nr:phage portal protein [Aneurinibacillus thermoaerophilus]
MDTAEAQWIPFSTIEKAEVPASARLPDTFKDSYDMYDLLAYPEGGDPASVKAIAKESNIIPQCVEAYVRNIPGYGVGLEYLPGESDETAIKEWERAERFLATATLEKPLETFLGEWINDLETCGNAYVEVAHGGEFPALYRIPPEYVRCTPELDRVEIKYKRLLNGKVEEFTQLAYIRKYAQKRNSNVVWFRQFGTTGEGNEIIHLRLGNDGPYGEPRWFGNTPGVLGARKAEELNLNYFKNGRMLSMILSVINGSLTPASIELLKTARGEDSQGGILYLQVKGDEMGGPMDEKREKTEIKLDKLNDLLQQDALFLEYNREKRKEILSAFRLPPILVGQSEDYTRATADAALRFAEEQIFQPYRKWLMDEIFNHRLFPSYDIHRVRAILRTPKIVEPEERKALLDYLADRGIMLVRHLIPIAEEVLDMPIDEKKYPAGYLDTPIMQLVNQQPFMMPPETDVKEQTAIIAKRILRQAGEMLHV